MDIYWYGQSCFKLKGKTSSLIIDPYLSDFTGLKLPKDLEADVVLSTHGHDDHNNFDAVLGNPVKINGPGEYEAKGISVSGISVFHDKSGGSERGKNTIYNILMEGLHIVHLGDLGEKLSDQQVADIGTVDVLAVPVGGTYTVNAHEAQEVVVQLEPKIVIPMHYSLPGLKFELLGVEQFLKEMGAESPETSNKLTITKDKLPEEPKIVVLKS